jgi:transcriptional regulator with XRE-family HTH domain
MNKVSANIRKIRERKGYSQEYMATELSISQASYARIESQDTQLTVERLLQIAKILETGLTELLGDDGRNVFNQTNNTESTISGYVENLHIENKETMSKLIESYKERIEELKILNSELKKEIDFLKKSRN